MLKFSAVTKSILAAALCLLVSSKSFAQLTWTWTYTGTEESNSGSTDLLSGSGTFTTASTPSASSNPDFTYSGYLITAISGTWTVGGVASPITSLVSPSENSDNLLGATFYQLDLAGVSFVSSGITYNIFYGGNANLQGYTDPSLYAVDTASYGSGQELGTFSADLSAVPEPSTYALIFGAAALGFAIYRRRQAAA